MSASGNNVLAQVAVRLTSLLAGFGVILVGHLAGLDLANNVVLAVLALVAVAVGHIVATRLAKARGWR